MADESRRTSLRDDDDSYDLDGRLNNLPPAQLSGDSALLAPLNAIPLPRAPPRCSAGRPPPSDSQPDTEQPGGEDGPGTTPPRLYDVSPAALAGVPAPPPPPTNNPPAAKPHPQRQESLTERVSDLISLVNSLDLRSFERYGSKGRAIVVTQPDAAPPPDLYPGPALRRVCLLLGASEHEMCTRLANPWAALFLIYGLLPPLAALLVGTWGWGTGWQPRSALPAGLVVYCILWPALGRATAVPLGNRLKFTAAVWAFGFICVARAGVMMPHDRFARDCPYWLIAWCSLVRSGACASALTDVQIAADVFHVIRDGSCIWQGRNDCGAYRTLLAVTATCAAANWAISMLVIFVRVVRERAALKLALASASLLCHAALVTVAALLGRAYTGIHSAAPSGGGQRRSEATFFWLSAAATVFLFAMRISQVRDAARRLLLEMRRVLTVSVKPVVALAQSFTGAGSSLSARGGSQSGRCASRRSPRAQGHSLSAVVPLDADALEADGGKTSGPRHPEPFVLVCVVEGGPGVHGGQRTSHLHGVDWAT